MKSKRIVREVARLDSPPVQDGIGPGHKVRRLIPPADFAFSDPFLLLMEDWFPLGVFGRHPHRGFETVTYVLDGSINHYDNHGNAGAIASGDALWLTAGRGIIHNEEPAQGEPVHLLQLWVNLPAESKFVPSRFQELRAVDMPIRHEAGSLTTVFSGASGGVAAQTRNYVPVTFLESRLVPGASLTHPLEAGVNAFIVALDGAVAVGKAEMSIAAGQLAWLDRCETASELVLSASDSGARVVIIAGMPLNEPIAARGPFVMNTDQEVEAAFEAFRRDGEKFGLSQIDQPGGQLP